MELKTGNFQTLLGQSFITSFISKNFRNGGKESLQTKPANPQAAMNLDGAAYGLTLFLIGQV